MSIPLPVKPAKPAHINPIDSAASYANQVLAGINSGAMTTPLPYMKQRAVTQSVLPARTLSDRQEMIRQSAAKQHQLRLQALNRAKQVSLSVPTRSVGAQSLRAPSGGFSGAFTGGIHGLTPQAGAALQRLNAAYRQRFGTDLTVNSGGRSRAEQARAYANYLAGRGNLAAPPGHSVHESGRAVDFGGPIQNAGSIQHIWLQQNAHKFGWLWTGKNFSQFEPWHWEFHG